MSVSPGLLGSIGTWRWWPIGASWGCPTIGSSRRDAPWGGVSIGPSTSWWSIWPSRRRTPITTPRGQPTAILSSTVGGSRVVATWRGSRRLSCSSWAALPCRS